MSPEKFKKSLQQQGVTITQWAEKHGFPREAVYRVLNGVEKGTFGRAHEIAVAAGIKQLPANDPTA
ncbi:MAG: DNA-binding protein [Ketobacter sp.]|nr:DNA-binding protein [Ketobacter sp.]